MGSNYNLYERKDRGWEYHEASRLKTMDDFLSAVTEHDLGYAFNEAAYTDSANAVSLIDIGAGTGGAIEKLCSTRGVHYYALDVNEAFLDGRTTPSDKKILGRSEAIPRSGHSFDITFSRAVTAWSKDPRKAISEQLRVTKLGGIAIFTEFDWSSSGIDIESPMTTKLMAARAIMMTALSLAGFRPEYGAHLGCDIDSVIEEQGLRCERKEIRHELPAADYREIFLGAANTILDQLTRARTGQATVLATMLSGYIKDIQGSSPFSFKLPALVTQVMRMPE